MTRASLLRTFSRTHKGNLTAFFFSFFPPFSLSLSLSLSLSQRFLAHKAEKEQLNRVPQLEAELAAAKNELVSARAAHDGAILAQVEAVTDKISQGSLSVSLAVVYAASTSILLAAPATR